MPQATGPGASASATARVERVILVDEQDREIGTAEKLAAHRDGARLHRAFSVFLFDERGRVLLQQRAAGKYHFALLWANSCCGHPRPGEALVAAAERRVAEELGLAVRLSELFGCVYAAEDPISGLAEREYDHVLVGHSSEAPDPDPEEVRAVEWQGLDELLHDLRTRPSRYTPWLHQLLPPLVENLARA